MRALVAGATGFIGRHLVRCLGEAGYEVRALARPTSDGSVLSDLKVEVRRGSIGDKDFLKSAVSGVDLVYNLIGQIGGWGVSKRDLQEANVTAVGLLLAACQDADVNRFVHCSTPGVVGMSGVASESLPCNPCGQYELSKLEGETIALGFGAEKRLSVAVARPDFVYGPGDLHKLKLFRAVKNRRFPLIGGGISLLHPTYIDDVVNGLLLVGQHPAACGEVFNLAGPGPVSVSYLVRCITRRLKCELPRLRVPTLAAKSAAAISEWGATLTRTDPLLTRYQVKFFTLDHASDISKARTVLGYEPQVSVEQGVDRTVRWYQDNKLL